MLESRNDVIHNETSATSETGTKQTQCQKTVTVTLFDWEIDLIADALNNLSESREEEIKWVGNDEELIRTDKAAIEEIETLCAKLSEAK